MTFHSFLKKNRIVVYDGMPIMPAHACERQNGMIKKFARESSVSKRENSASELQKAANTLGLHLQCRTRYCLSGKWKGYLLCTETVTKNTRLKRDRGLPHFVLIIRDSNSPISRLRKFNHRYLHDLC